MTEKDNNSCDSSCVCARGVNRRDFLKLAAAAAGLLAGCSPTEELLTPTSEPIATSPPTPIAMVTPTALPDLTGKKVVYILPHTRFASVCHAGSHVVLEVSGASITLASWKLKEIRSFSGGASPLKPDMLVSDVRVADFDAVIFECGQPMAVEDPEAQRITQEAVEQGKVLAAICMMPAIFAIAGVLEGKRAACNDDYAEILKTKGAILSDTTIERDGNIVTASFDGNDMFGWVIAEALAG